MDWVKRMQCALSYVEDHLTADVRAEEVAREINSSAFHFQRMFVMLTGITFAEYVRRRRLTMAARDLITTSDSIADVAARYRCESQASFTRAFGRMHGFPPGKARDPGMSISAYPPQGWSVQEFPAVTYAIFKDQGTPLPKAIEKTLTRIFHEWFPSTQYEHAGGPEIEVYHDESRYEIWIPVITQ